MESIYPNETREYKAITFQGRIFTIPPRSVLFVFYDEECNTYNTTIISKSIYDCGTFDFTEYVKEKCLESNDQPKNNIGNEQ